MNSASPLSVYEYGPVVLRKTVGPALEAASLGTIHGVLLSHDQHADNLDVAGRALLYTVPRVVTTPAGAARLGGNSIGLAPWDSTDLTALNGTRAQVVATPASHGPPGIEPISGEVTGFVIRLASPAATRAFASAVIVPVHHEGWAHYSEARDDVARVFASAGLGRRITWLQPGRTTVVQPYRVASR